MNDGRDTRSPHRADRAAQTEPADRADKAKPAFPDAPSVRFESLFHSGAPVTALYPGWRLLSRHHALEGLEVVLFGEGRSRREACWWVTPEGAHVASHALALPEDHRARLLNKLARVLGPLTEDTLTRTPEEDAALDADAQATAQTLAALPRSALLELLALWTNLALSGTLIVSAQEILAPPPEDTAADRDVSRQDAADPEASSNKDEAPFSAARLRHLLSLAPPADQNVSDEKAPPLVMALSPFTGLPLRAQLVMRLPEGVAARFSDPDDDLVFYLFWPAKGGVPLLYYPRGPILLGDGPLTRILPSLLLAWFVAHPEAGAEARAAQPFRPEDFGAGAASSAWDSAWGEDEENESLESLGDVASPPWEEWLKNAADPANWGQEEPTFSQDASYQASSYKFPEAAEKTSGTEVETDRKNGPAERRDV